MKRNSYRCLLAINLYELTGAQLGELKEKNFIDRHAYKFLPEYCLTKEGKIADTEMYLQFINSGDEKFYLFSFEHTDQPLKEEFSNMGIDYALQFDFSFLKTLQINKYEDMFLCLPLSSHIVVEVKYVESGSHEYPEVDAEFSLVGYLNQNKELVKLPE